jgi:membrane protein
LALFPALLFLIALLGLLPLEQTMASLRNVLPSDALSLGEKYLQQVVKGSGGDILSLGLLGALWIVLQWPVVMCLMLIAVAVIYYVSPCMEQDWRWVSPGSLFAVIMWLLVSLGFKLYVENFGNYNKAYGSIACVIVLMLWFYLSGIVLLMGGEIIEKTAHERASQHAEPQPVQRHARA